MKNRDQMLKSVSSALDMLEMEFVKEVNDSMKTPFHMMNVMLSKKRYHEMHKLAKAYIELNNVRIKLTTLLSSDS